ncbi:putative inactive ATP-dependent zinc metalloprotease FTSHI 3, chloroplastic [Turnera subulata]|uniref:Inactive ATP-dependent zinc metalloprotease FTSHI 3, chloroplastic n=1 Tax=Turnera subulata TaxID=218843 RepID=A0A9Q0F5L9_9ROSI|nr:putative inactive ATP-dependent zinc metalloprotease FTSHI 3, chloroplastic [Turnera subulata]
MACCSVVCSNGLLTSTRDDLRVHTVKTKSLSRYSTASVCYSSVLIPSFGLCCTASKSRHFLLCSNKVRSICGGRGWGYSLGFWVCFKSQNGLSCGNKIGPLAGGGGSGTEATRQGKGGDSGVRRRFSLRLRPRLRLLTMRVKRVSIRSMLNDYRTFLRKNMKRVTLYTLISVALGMCYLLLRLTTLPSPKIVPYSDFISSLQSGSVTNVLLEEDSRRIYYSTNIHGNENTQNLGEKSVAVNEPYEDVVDAEVRRGGASESVNDPYQNVADADAREGDASTSSIYQISKLDLSKKFSRRQASAPEWQFSTRKVDHDEKFLLSLMREKGTAYRSAPQSALVSIRSTLITITILWIPLIPLMWLIYRQLSTANSPARKRRPNDTMPTFNDVEGVDAAKAELKEIVSCLQGAMNYEKLGAKLPRGVLLVGPPGTGKTLLARAVAGEAGVPFFSVSASEFVELFVGRGAARIRDLFSVARKRTPSIIFIDELDAVGGRRGRSFNDERDQTLNQLLTEMDGFESDMKVVVIAATNRPEALDPALCRPGRFSRKVLVGEPDEEGRRKILAVHLRGVPIEEDSDLICNLVASLTPGFVGADLANIVNEAALLAARRGGENVTREDVMDAIERAKFGINDRQLRPGSISKELGKLFPWMPSLMGRNDTRQDGSQGPLGYQTLS